MSRLKHLECQSSLSSAPSDEDGQNRRKVKKNSKYSEFFEEGTKNKCINSSKPRVKPSLQLDSSDEEPYIPNVPSIARYAFPVSSKRFQQTMGNGSSSSKHSSISRDTSVSIENDTTLVNQPEPVFTFEQMCKSLRRIESKYFNVFQYIILCISK